ncbi:MAG: hypothetical protein II716_10935 [Treponema sp.]|nr:hypothetical protein [Treponema sp.]
MRILSRGVKESCGSTILFSVALIFAFSVVMIGLVSWINLQHEKVRKEYRQFYESGYVVQDYEESFRSGENP